MRKSILLAILVLIPASFAHAQIPTAEREALIALYDATNGAGWTNNSGWATATEGTECTWHGVSCLGGHVRILNMYNNGLNGFIPSDLENLSDMTHLVLKLNTLSGGIPWQLGNLSNLETLQLGENQLIGLIPKYFQNLSSITLMELNDNELSGEIPTELGYLSSLQWLDLSANELSGSIPAQLGNLSNLTTLVLDHNQLSGPIPPQLWDLPNLGYLHAEFNQLSGSIPPPDPGDLPSLENLRLDHNHLSGKIPSELGQLTSLEFLYLHSNLLSMSIPTELENLTALRGGVGLDLRWNALHSDPGSLITFLDSKQYTGDWQSTQTIAPENLIADSVHDHTVWLRWDAVSYHSDPGGYEVFSAPTGSGVWTSGGWTEAKTDTTFPVTGLLPGTTYDFEVVTYTDPHADNLNLVKSDFSPQVMTTTASGGCAQPTIEIACGDPITLSVPGSYDSYLWITGETTSTIDPLFEQWYWVTVTSGSCEETAATSVDPTSLIFADGFESGGTSEWSTTVP